METDSTEGNCIVKNRQKLLFIDKIKKVTGNLKRKKPHGRKYFIEI